MRCPKCRDDLWDYDDESYCVRCDKFFYLVESKTKLKVLEVEGDKLKCQ
jgi:hypothetical protein